MMIIVSSSLNIETWDKRLLGMLLVALLELLLVKCSITTFIQLFFFEAACLFILACANSGNGNEKGSNT
jgi:hypothetical protein